MASVSSTRRKTSLKQLQSKYANIERTKEGMENDLTDLVNK